MLTQEAPSMTVRWPVVRVKQGGCVRVILLSGDWVRLVTHFFRKTFLCPEVSECDACNVLPSRPYWYLPVLDQATHRSSILELSSHASADLEQRARFVGASVSAGLQVELSRRSQKAPVSLEVYGISDSPAVATWSQWSSSLMALYQLPMTRPGEMLEDYGRRVQPIVIERAKLVATWYRESKDGKVHG